MYMEWTESYSTGIARFDDQHKKLFALVNALLDGIKDERRKEAMGEVLDELVQYTVSHFSEEEKEMMAHNYSGYDEHKKEHDELTSKVRDFRTRYKAGTALMTVELLGFIVNWLKTHIAGTDKKYAPFLIEKGVA